MAGARPRVDLGGLVVITGAASGIGRATAEAFAAKGATVVCGDINEAGAAVVAEGLDARGGRGRAAHVDVGDVDSWERFAADVHRDLGVPDVVVNNAGIGMGGPFLQHRADDWRRIVDVNLLGVVHGCRLFAAQMVDAAAAGGHGDGCHLPSRRHIVNVASAAGFTPSRSLPAYATTKAGVMMLSECLRAELGSQGVGVSAICPGFIATGIYRSSRFVDLDPAQEAERGNGLADLSERWLPGPDVVADRILSAVVRDRPVVPVTAGAWTAYVVAHASPPGMRRAARLGEDTFLAGLDRLDRLAPVLRVAAGVARAVGGRR